MSRRRSLLFAIAAFFMPKLKASPRMSDELLDAMKFRGGDQWNPEFRKLREDRGRPCIVNNQVPWLMKRAAKVNASLSDGDLTLMVVRKVRDMQVMYNVAYSNHVECPLPAWDSMMNRLRADMITAVECPRYILVKDGTPPMSKEEFSAEYERQTRVHIEARPAWEQQLFESDDPAEFLRRLQSQQGG